MGFRAQALPTERRSGLSTVFRRAFAAATTEVANPGSNSALGEAAMHNTLPCRKASSPGRVEVVSSWREREGGVGAALAVRAPSVRAMAESSLAVAAAASSSARSAASTSSCRVRKRCRRRDAVSLARRSACSKRASVLRGAWTSRLWGDPCALVSEAGEVRCWGSVGGKTESGERRASSVSACRRTCSAEGGCS